MRHRVSIAALAATIGIACASPPYLEPFEVDSVRPGPGEAVLVENSVIIFDASGSIDSETLFPREKALLESFVSAMPSGHYRSSLRVLGGHHRDELELERFDRWQLQDQVRRLPYGGRETPLARVLDTLTESLLRPSHPSARNVVVIFTDGVPTRFGHYVGPTAALQAARRLRAQQGAAVCFHLIQLGDDPRAAALLQPLLDMNSCGSSQKLAEIEDRERLRALQRRIYIGPAPPVEPASLPPMTDLDLDGVDDRFDRCANTPRRAHVDYRGCWVIEDTVFETDRARILDTQRPVLDRVADVLRRNPSVRVRLDGHTDARGAERYNFDLGERRARAVGRYLEELGIAAERLQFRSFGASRPIADNGRAQGRSLNRRVELSVIDW